MTPLDDALDRALASSDGVAVIMLALAALVLWYRRIVPPPMARLLPINNREVDVERMLTTLAVVLTALAMRYAVNVGSLMGYWPQSAFGTDLVRLMIVYLVIAASTAALRTATYPVFGNGATLVFIGLGTLGGCTLYVWG